MNAAPENDPSKAAKERLAAVCRTRDKSLRLAWAITICEGILVGGLALALFDYWLMLPLKLRAVGALGLAGLVGIGVFRLVRFYRHPTRLKQGALELEARRPELGCEISTAAEYLSGERKIVHEYEPELVAALEARAAQKLAARPPENRSKTTRYIALVGGTLLLLLLFVLLVPSALTALKRAALPFFKTHYTQVQVRPGNVEIPVGHDITITNLFTGREPKDPVLAWREEGSATWQKVALARSAVGDYVHAFSNVRTDLTYQVSGSDAKSDEYRIATYIPPEVKDLSVRLSYPDYTRSNAITLKTPEITVVRASTAQFRIEPTVDLSKARLRFSTLPEVVLAPAQDGSWMGTLKITKDAEYWIEMADKKGHIGMNEKPYHIKALPDSAPKVEITDPGKDIRASATNTVPIKISASDDFGVGDIKLVFHKLNGTEQDIAAKRESQRNGEVVATAELDLSKLELRDYELVAYHAEAADNNTLDGPGVGKSQVYFIEITNKEGGQALAQGQGQKVNLLVIQKQIIADTTALAANGPADKFQDLATRQRDAAEFARMYLEAISGGGAEATATEMQAALKDMETAGGQLDKQKRSEALPAEEGALGHLYQALKLMPELENLPTTPEAAKEKPPQSPKVQVVLEAIKQKKKEAPNDKELEDALEKAKDLARSQSGINGALQRMAQSGEANQSQNMAQNQAQGEGQGEGSGQAQGSGKEGKAQEKQQAQADGKDGTKAKEQAEANGKGQGEGKGEGKEQAEANGKGQGKGKGEGKEQAQAKGKGQGQGKGQGTGKDQEQAEKANGEGQNGQEASELAEVQDPAQLAEKENNLSKEAAALAEKLQRLAGKDTRLGHNAGAAAGHAAGQMKAAGQALKQGTADAAGEHGFQGELAMRSVVAQLERVLKDQPDPSDIATEDYPKQYESLISEYLKKLSHAE